MPEVLSPVVLSFPFAHTITSYVNIVWNRTQNNSHIDAH